MSGEVIIYVIIYVVPYKLTQLGHDAQKWFLIVGALCMPLRRDVELRRRRYEHSHDATQLDVALSCPAINPALLTGNRYPTL